MSNIARKGSDGGETVVPTMCGSHCGGTCFLKVHVKDGVITRIETDDGEEPQMRACLRGRAYRERVYAPDRIKYPLKRVGARGEGKFERISWDEALDTIAREMKRISEKYGPQTMFFWISAGDQGMLHDNGVRLARLFSFMGSQSLLWGSSSFEGGIFAELATYGTAWGVSSTRDDLVNSRLIVLWGWDPAMTIGNTNTMWYLLRAKEAGARVISIDPRYTPSTAVLAHQYIPIRPGTDAAMLIAMANVMVTENLQDQGFLDRYTVGFDVFKDYILGVEDGISKTPIWAEPITGVPAGTIRKLAEEYATTKPAALMAGIAPGRTAYGEQYHRAAITLSAMTGNIGIPGGSAGGRAFSFESMKIGRGLRVPPTPNATIKISVPKDMIANRGNYIVGRGLLNCHKIADAILEGKAGGYPADFKLLYVATSSFLNQEPNINRTIEAFKKLEFIVVEEQFMSPTAQFADIVLPTTTLFERSDIVTGNSEPPLYGYRPKVIEPLHESKPQMEIANELAARLDIADFNTKTDEEWLKLMMEGSDVSDYETFKKRSMHKILKTRVAFSREIEDPANNPFPTPSGKIEIYSQLIADMGNPETLPAIPKYIETWESLNDPLAVKYPLQFITSHSRRRAHSQFDNLPWLREVETQAIKISTGDAMARNIQDGDLVKVFNDRGTMVIPAKVTERIMPGVVELPQGAWYRPDENGVDRGGSTNVLMRDEPSPGRALVTNTCLVQIEKWTDVT